MNKLTKAEYNKRKTEIENRIEKIKQLQSKYEAIIQDDTSSIKDMKQYGLLWDDLQDSLSVFIQKQNDLEDEWRRRDWEFSDYMQHNLIANNID
jgi:hypothetical protein